jgi:hypothetical protein
MIQKSDEDDNEKNGDKPNEEMFRPSKTRPNDRQLA